MNKLLTVVTALVAMFILNGCSTTGKNGYTLNSAVPISSNRVDFSNTETVKLKLFEQLRNWKGAPYVIGGLSRKGIDCSGFVYVTFREKLGLDIPRTTKLQSGFGKEIPKSKLRPGDLVFFKTGFNVRHVGIYIEGGKFIHASSTKGVMVSALNNSYWNDKYWHSRRAGI